MVLSDVVRLASFSVCCSKTNNETANTHASDQDETGGVICLRTPHATSIRQNLADSSGGRFSGVVALDAAAFGGPVYEALHVFAVFPGEMKEFAGRHIGSFFSEKGFEAPAQVRALPRLQTIASGRVPVVGQCL